MATICLYLPAVTQAVNDMSVVQTAVKPFSLQDVEEEVEEEDM